VEIAPLEGGPRLGKGRVKGPEVANTGAARPRPATGGASGETATQFAVPIQDAAGGRVKVGIRIGQKVSQSGLRQLLGSEAEVGGLVPQPIGLVGWQLECQPHGRHFTPRPAA